MAKSSTDKVWFAKKGKKMMVPNKRNMQVSILEITEKAYYCAK